MLVGSQKLEADHRTEQCCCKGHVGCQHLDKQWDLTALIPDISSHEKYHQRPEHVLDAYVAILPKQQQQQQRDRYRQGHFDKA